MKNRKGIFIVVLLMMMLMSSAAFAEEAPSIGVQLNGYDVVFSDAVPVNENGRVYVPFRAVFEALDADVDYRAEDGQIMAEKDGVQVTFKVGENSVTVNNQTASTITIDAPPFIRDGRTYVPVRFAAQTLGLEVGWDSAASTVVMLDKDALKEQAKGQYTLMDQYLKFAQTQKLTGPVKTEGNIQFEMQMANGSGADAEMIPITGNMELSGISDATAAELNMAIELNLDDLKAVLQQEEALTEENQTVLDALKQMDMQVLTDTEKGKAYMKSNMFGMAGMDANAWYMVDLNQLLAQSGMDLQAMLESEAKALDSYEESVMQMIDSLTTENAMMCGLMLDILDLYRDDAFQRVGNNYISSMKYDMNGMAMSMSMTLKTNGSAVTGYQEAVTMYMGTAPIMSMKVDQTGMKQTMDMNMNVQGVLTMKMNGDIRYTATAEKPQTMPPAGSIIQDMTSSMTNSAA